MYCTRCENRGYTHTVELCNANEAILCVLKVKWLTRVLCAALLCVTHFIHLHVSPKFLVKDCTVSPDPGLLHDSVCLSPHDTTRCIQCNVSCLWRKQVSLNEADNKRVSLVQTNYSTSYGSSSTSSHTTA